MYRQKFDKDLHGNVQVYIEVPDENFLEMLYQMSKHGKVTQIADDGDAENGPSAIPHYGAEYELGPYTAQETFVPERAPVHEIVVSGPDSMCPVLQTVFVRSSHWDTFMADLATMETQTHPF